MTYGLTTVTSAGHSLLAVWTEGWVLPISKAVSRFDPQAPDPPATMRSALADWERWCTLAETASHSASAEEGWTAETEANFAPAITNPPNLYCAGANYRDHAKEMGDGPIAERPFHFLGSTSALIGHNHTVIRPEGGQKLDWEVELAVVIGRDAYRVAAEDALSLIAGYTVVNDLSLRDAARRDDVPFNPDWLLSKSQSGFFPLGPAIVPADTVTDSANLALKLTVNGDIRQSSNTAQMIFSVAEQIEFLSRIVPLQPGDVISTGTPAGTAAKWGRYLEPGDVVIAEVETVGRLCSRIVGP